MINANGSCAVLAGHALLVPKLALDLHLLSREHGPIAPGTRIVVIVSTNLGRVIVGKRSLIFRESLLEADLAVNLLVRSFMNIVKVQEGSGTLHTTEAF